VRFYPHRPVLPLPALTRMVDKTTPSRYEELFDGFTETRSGNNTIITPLRSYVEGSNGWSAVQTGSPVPGYRVKIKRGTNASSYYRRSWGYVEGKAKASYTQVAAPFLGFWRQSGTFYGNKNNAFAVGGFPTDTVLADIAVARLKQRISSEGGDFKAMAPLAELKELRSMIKSSADLTSGLIVSLANIKRTKGRSAYKYASQAWLNFNFGIKPLVADTKAACESVTKFIERNDHTRRLFGQASKSWKSSSTTGGGFGQQNATLTVTRNCFSELSYLVVAGVSYKMSSANNYGALDHFHLELGALPSVAWELTPYSWAVDYFTTVGDYLDDVFVGDSTSTKYVNQCIRFRQSVTNDYNWKSNDSSGYPLSNTPGSYSSFYGSFERTPLSGIPTRQLRFRSFDELGRSSINRVLNLSAILLKK